MLEQLETWHIILIIATVLAVVWSNIALLKYSAKFDIKGKIDKQTKPTEHTVQRKDKDVE
ncbi:DUF2897 family protein [Pseudoalteromonas sp. JBTF-M23]|uniref:DUF2897 family protein n=1 Tax=Pseudoalteromonas caenipelagi TaxID=2726988 RepID=A0A849VCS8_9GAMM|nr:DUF2897 family protein [Pseudoalteromonas caenipelagi]NOU50865.1 DUF2897 family protein [Pseudoalteromonas caenipelagi]